MDADEALSWVERILRERKWEAYEKAVARWCSSLPAFAKPPDPPEPPED